MVACLAAQSVTAAGSQEAGDEIGPLVGGVGGAYFLAEAGDLVVEVEKRDRNLRGARVELRAILAGPDRRVLQEVSIPDDGKPRGSGTGPPQRARLSARVDRRGIYALNVTVSNDRYGEEIAWGFRTNCRRYIIETSRGHKDELHQEPIVLLSPERPVDVCFLPRRGAFGVKVDGLPRGAGEPCLYDSKGSIIAYLKSDGRGSASCSVQAGSRDSAPWRLHLPKGQGTIHIDGVTRWDRGDERPDLTCWTHNLSAWFPFTDYRWLLTPYSRTVYGRPGQERSITFQVRNDSRGKISVRLALEFPLGEWPARLSSDRLALGPKESSQVIVRAAVPAEGQSRVVHLRATPEDAGELTTYSTLIVKGGEAPASRPLALPLVLKPYQHENEQLGYLPDYPVDSQPYFDLKNRPYVRTARGLETFRDGSWVVCDRGASSGRAPSKVAFDRDNDLYLLAGSSLLHSPDGGRTFTATEIPGGRGMPRSFDLEQFSGHNVPDGPPPVLRYTQTAADPQRIWRRLNDLELFLPRKEGGRLSIGNPIMISKKCIGLSAHSGIPSAVVSQGMKVHVVWGEATDPAEKVPGVPMYAATWDREAGKLSEAVLLGYGAPPNDVHNSPSVTMDSQGYLHVLLGTHGKPFLHARSLKPNDTGSGWTEAQPTGEGLPQTYIGLVCGKDDSLVVAFRLWRSGVEPFTAGSHGTLAVQLKRPGGAWEPPQVLVVPPFSEYSIFYHRLTVDRAGRLFLSYDYWSTFWFYRTDHFGHRRALMVSPDGGRTWKLAETRDLH